MSSKGENPLVSVVMPTYNRINTIERAIRSVLDQTYKNIELIVVDDGSTDNTIEVIESLMDNRIKILSQNHKGANSARNWGIKNAKGKFIAFQDSDDEWLPDKLEKQVTYMLENAYEVCYCPFFLCGEDSESIPFIDYNDKIKYEENLIEILRIENVVSTQTLVIQQNIISDVGIFDEEMPRYQDYEFVIRIIQKKRIGYVNEPLVRLFLSENSITNDMKKLREANIKLLEKHADFFNIELYLQYKIRDSINELGKQSLYKRVESIDLFLKKYLVKKDINVYKIAMEILDQKYLMSKSSCIREYEMRVKQLQSRKFVIYGAGNIGEKIYQALLHKDLHPQCFLVTKKKREDNKLYGIPIVELEEWDEKNLEIIVGVSQDLQCELIKNLIRLGYKNYFRYPY